jgi:ATP:corrinoid adenosyltransferase
VVVAGPGASVEAKKRIDELNRMIESNDWAMVAGDELCPAMVPYETV